MLLKQALQSRVGQRLFVSFVLATLLPILVLAGYAYSKVSQVLTQSTNQHLQQESKMVGMMIVDRLNKQAEKLHMLTVEHPGVISASWLKLSGFTYIEPVTESIRASLSPEQIQQLAQGRVVLLSGVARAGGMEMLVQPATSKEPLIAGLNTQSWWQDDILPEDFCILSRNGRLVYCSPSLAPEVRTWPPNLFEGANTGAFAIDQGGLKFAAGYWNVSLDALYAMPGFVFVVAEQDQSALTVLFRFKLFFIALALLAVSSAAWVAVRQIRRQLLPLNQLMAGTKRLAEGDFENTIPQASDDEFGQLATSFNIMSDSLNRKFHVLKKLDELDHSLLGSAELATLFRVFFSDLKQSLPADVVLIVHREGAGRFAFYSSDELPVREFSTGDGVQACEDLFDRVGGAIEGFLNVVDIREEKCLVGTPISGVQHAFMMPIKIGHQTVSLLTLGFVHPGEITEDIIQSARIFSERLSVAAGKLEADQKLYHQAHHDPLTHLPNRVLLAEHTEHAILRSDRNGSATALLLADLDGFKHINDSLGHEAGDMLLQICAKRLRENLRASDTVARYGGDEFILLLPDLDRDTAVDDVFSIINKLQHVFHEPIDLLGRMVLIDFSVGVALYPNDASSFHDLLKMADTAMYVAKNAIDKSFAFFNQHMNHEVRHRFELMQELKTAIDKNELRLFYQPKVDALTGMIVGAEALARWQSPTRGLVMPGEFIPLLDQMGMSPLLGEWVIEAACAQMQAWDERICSSVSVSINLSPLQFLDESLCEKIHRAIERHDLSPSRLEIEILEDTAVDGSKVVQDNLVALRQKGFTIALDDFGTGYSSLVNLINVPANVLKLDRSFISDIATNTKRQSTVEHIIALAKTLDFQLVAEGIEEKDQAEWLKTKGCDQLQGYLYGRPVPAADFEKLVCARHDSMATDDFLP